MMNDGSDIAGELRFGIVTWNHIKCIWKMASLACNLSIALLKRVPT